MQQLPFFVNILIVLLAIFAIVLKVYAAWMACKNNHKKWFVALVILNTIGILEVFYIFKIAKKSWTEVKGDFQKVFPSVK